MAEALFSKSARGYNREQVDAFLLELNRNFAEKEKELDARIRELSSALADTEARLKEAEEGKAALEKELADLQASIGQRMLQADARAEEILANARKQAQEEGERLIAETRKGCAVIGQAVAEFTTRLNTVTAEMNKTEKLLDLALEDVKRKAGIRKA
ncbi:MAG: DivIVA domain-containing protein [Clostridia bacterium]|nr:DivIVA domain-containing protein [Clostridia bacterium]